MIIPLFLSVFLLMAFNVLAQNSSKSSNLSPCTDAGVKCGESCEFKWDGSNAPFDDSYTVSRAQDSVKKWLMLEANLYCKQTCLRPRDICEPAFVRFIEGGVRQLNGRIFVTATVRSEIKCSDCPVITGKINPLEDPNLQEFSIDAESLLKEHSDLARIKSVYPNPNDGLMNLDLMVFQPNSKVTLQLLDISGKSHYREEQLDVSDTLVQTQLDLQHLNTGLYFLRVEVNGVLAATKKVSIQK